MAALITLLGCRVVVLLVTCLFIVPTLGIATSCKQVQQGHHYPNALNIPEFLGFREGNQETTVTFQNNSAEYLLSGTSCKGDDGDVSCWMCQTSWNKLYGASRCGRLQPHHEDSDRFVWRRHLNCVEHNGSTVVGNKADCKETEQIELAAAAYDGGIRPYGNASLFHEFSTVAVVGKPITLRLTYGPNFTDYAILDGPSGHVIETHTIQHRQCEHFSEGYNLGFFFGGQCPEPSASSVSACYEDQHVQLSLV